MCEFELNYKDGREVRKGERVVFNKVRPAVISEILCPGSMGACEWRVVKESKRLLRSAATVEMQSTRRRMRSPAQSHTTTSD